MSAFGFVPVDTLDGADYHGKMRDVTVDDGTASFVGDFMSAGTQVAADQNQRVRTSLPADAFAPLVGALMSLYPDFTDEGSLISNYAPAGGGDRQGRVVRGNDVVYQAREDADASALTGTAIGSAVDLINPGGSTVTGMSGMLLDSSSLAATGQFLVRRLGLLADNAFATAGQLGAVFEVSINPAAT